MFMIHLRVSSTFTQWRSASNCVRKKNIHDGNRWNHVFFISFSFFCMFGKPPHSEYELTQVQVHLSNHSFSMVSYSTCLIIHCSERKLKINYARTSFRLNLFFVWNRKKNQYRQREREKNGKHFLMFASLFWKNQSDGMIEVFYGILNNDIDFV